MNRRNFLRGLLTAAAGFTILPPATTYERIWRARREINPDWVTAPLEMRGGVFSAREFAGTWQFVCDWDLDNEYRADPSILFKLPS